MRTNRASRALAPPPRCDRYAFETTFKFEIAAAEAGTLRGVEEMKRQLTPTSTSTVLATGCDDTVIRTFSVATGQQTRELRGCTSFVWALALSGSMLVSGDGAFRRAGQVKVWALTGEASAECVATLEGHSNAVCGVVAGPGFVASQTFRRAELLVWRPA